MPVRVNANIRVGVGVGGELGGDLGIDQEERGLAFVPGEVGVGVFPDVGHAANLADEDDVLGLGRGRLFARRNEVLLDGEDVLAGFRQGGQAETGAVGGEVGGAGGEGGGSEEE